MPPSLIGCKMFPTLLLRKCLVAKSSCLYYHHITGLLQVELTIATSLCGTEKYGLRLDEFSFATKGVAAVDL